MLKKTIFVGLFALTALITFAIPNSKKCALCGSTMMWSGHTKMEWGKLVYEMKCPAGHVSWEVDEQSRAPNYNRGSGLPSCQYDGGSMYFTGKAKTEWGKMLKEYKCPSGHITWVTD